MIGYLYIRTEFSREFRVQRSEVKLNNPVFEEDRVVIRHRVREECEICDGTGNCTYCGGEYDLCEHCWEGECYNCEGWGHYAEWEDAYMSRENYDDLISSEIQSELTKKALEIRYGTPSPASIRDYWVSVPA